MGKIITLAIQEADAITAAADVLALKYATNFYGADHAVAARLLGAGVVKDLNDLRVRSGFKVVDSQGAVAARQVLFIATPRPREFTYSAVRELAVDTLYQMKYSIKPAPRTLATTIHGVGFGLDEIESFNAQIAGFLEAIRTNEFPESLEQITIVEISERRVERLRHSMSLSLDAEPSAALIDRDTRTYTLDVDALRGVMPAPAARERQPAPAMQPAAPTAIEREAARSDTEKLIFVAMPFHKDFEDLWEFGLYLPIRDLGMQASRIDQHAFTGDIFDQIKFRIETAAVVIGVLDNLNPNVFLEIGYAMGKTRPTILVVHKQMLDERKLPFDLMGQRCIGYENIKDLKRLLMHELEQLRQQGVV
ncbi:MAG: hypothetical protein SF162_10535 [bacterium]|nr:hypothetical protein [bacterium]